MMTGMSEPIPIPIRSFEEPEADAHAGDDVAIAEAMTEVAVAFLGLGAGLIREVARERGVPPEGPSERLLEAGAGFAIEALRTMGAWAGALERTLAEQATTNPAARSAVAHGRSTLERTTQDREDAAAAALASLLEAVLQRLDLTTIVREHVDIDAIAAGVDPGPIVARLDMNALTDRMDMDRLAERIDIDELVARLDIEAVIDRLDLAALATAVMQELDLPELIRETAGDAASDEVRQLRLRSVDADRLVQRAVDRVLGRRREP